LLWLFFNPLLTTTPTDTHFVTIVVLGGTMRILFYKIYLIIFVSANN
jgi:hypothetical protein